MLIVLSWLLTGKIREITKSLSLKSEFQNEYFSKYIPKNKLKRQKSKESFHLCSLKSWIRIFKIWCAPKPGTFWARMQYHKWENPIWDVTWWVTVKKHMHWICCICFHIICIRCIWNIILFIPGFHYDLMIEKQIFPSLIPSICMRDTQPMF